MNRTFKPLAIAGAFAATIGFALPASGEVVKIAFIDPLSGPLANVGQNQFKSFQYIAEQLNKKKAAGNDVTFEIVGFDNKASPQESLTQLKAAQDQGIRYVTQGN